MRYLTTILCLALACILTFSGCGKQETESSNPPEVSEIILIEEIQDVELTETSAEFDYAPGYIGVYVKSGANFQVDADVLDSITMTLSDQKEELTRVKVSNSQFDFVKQGHQIGGFVLLDIPRETLIQKPNSWEAFLSVVDPIARQVMADIYPSEAYICGGGHLDFQNDLPVYMTFMIQNEQKDQYIHNIYIGEKYIYDFWLDTGWMADGGGTIMQTLSAQDIKPELNQADEWNIHEFEDFPGNSKN